MSEDYLMHYGVLGMKWGLRKSKRYSKQIPKLKKKASKADYKHSKYSRSAEKIHMNQDLGYADKSIKKASKYAVKSSRYKKKMSKTVDEDKKLRYNKKAARYAYKSSKYKIDADRISKTTGYGRSSMDTLIRANEYKKLADKYRYKIAKKEYYINSVNKKLAKMSPEDLDMVYNTKKKYEAV